MSEQQGIEAEKVRNAGATDESPAGGVAGTRVDDVDTEQSAALSSTGMPYVGGPTGGAPIGDGGLGGDGQGMPGQETGV